MKKISLGAKAKAFFDRYVVVREAAYTPDVGELHIVTPGGKIEINAVIGSENTKDVKRVLDILLGSKDSDFDTFIGRTE